MVTLLLLPGMDGTGELFEPFVAALGGEFQVKVVRYPNAKSLGYAELESFARAAIPTEGPYVILGESFSGPIAVSLSASASDRLKGLVLCCSFVRNPRAAFSGMSSLVSFLPVALAPVGILSHMVLGRFSTSTLRSMIAHAVAHVSPQALRARLRAVLAVNVSAKLTSVAAPILYLRASQDRLVPASASEQVSRLNKQTKVVELKGPHFLLQSAPVEAAQVVSSFLRDIQNAP
jgi:pimeloyl-ACP methyl ester carboxylesterase